MSVGLLEIVVVLVVALLVFGPSRLPQAGRHLGQALGEFRRATTSARTELGFDGIVRDVEELKSSLSLDLGVDRAKEPATQSRQVAVADTAAAQATGTPSPEVGPLPDEGHVADAGMSAVASSPFGDT